MLEPGCDRHAGAGAPDLAVDPHLPDLLARARRESRDGDASTPDERLDPDRRWPLATLATRPPHEDQDLDDVDHDRDDDNDHVPRRVEEQKGDDERDQRQHG